MKRRFYIPTRVQWTTEAASDEQARLQRTVFTALRRAIESAAGSDSEIAIASFESPENQRELFSPTRHQPQNATYAVPSYQDAGQLIPLPLQEADGTQTDAGATGTAASSPSTERSVTDIAGIIRSSFPTSQGQPSQGIYYGAYTRLGADGLRLYYLTLDDQQREILRAARLSTGQGDQQADVRLSAGQYTLMVRPYGKGQLYRGNRLITANINNLENLDITVQFTVPPEAGADEEITVTAYAYRFYPRLQILRVSQELPTDGSQSVYLAEVEIWGRDDSGNWYRVYPLALIYAFVHYQWEIWKITPPAKSSEQEQRRRIRSVELKTGFLRHVWEEAGTYEITCQISIHNYEEASPRPVSDRRRETVVRLEVKMALALAQLEQQERQPGAQRIWSRSATELLNQYRQLLQEEQNKSEPNQAKIRVYQNIITQLERHLVNQTTAGPFPIRAIFSEKLTSQTRPLTLFVGPAQEPNPDAEHTWHLIDLTYPQFYATYTGIGSTSREAIIAAFEDSRTSFRGKYPPGRIMARLEWPGMERYGIQAQDFVIETESWQRSAYEWLAFGATAIASVGLAAAIVFPPSAIVTGVLVIGAATGATVSAINIIERIETNSFEWDVETFSDIVNIAASFAFVGAAAARGVTSGITRSIASGRPFTISAFTRLRQLVRFERAMLYFGIGSDLSIGVILAWDTYVQLRDLDAAFSEQTLAEYRRIYGDEEGRNRWQNERYVRILGLLARAAVNGLLIAVSVRGAKEASTQRRAFLRQPRIPGAERSVSRRLGIEPGRPIGAFPETEFIQDRAGFVQHQRDALASRLNTTSAEPVIARLSPQSAWQINTALSNLSHEQQQLLLRTLRRGTQDLLQMNTFLRNGGNLEELANFLHMQPSFIRDGLNTFDTAVNRFNDFKALSGTIPNLETFRWEPNKLDEHFRRHVLGESGYTEESWKWAQRLGIAEEYALSRADYLRLLSSNNPGDVALKHQIFSNFKEAYGDYVRTVMARTNVFSRSARGAELVGSDGELIWFANSNGTISSGYFPNAPTTRTPGSADDLQGILLNAIRNEQSVLQMFTIPHSAGSSNQ